MKPAPSHQFIQMLAGRWTLGVLAELAEGGRRYQDIDDTLNGVLMADRTWRFLVRLKRLAA